MAKITIDGITYQGKDINVIDGKVTVDGKLVTTLNETVKTILVKGELASLTTDLNVSCDEVHGDVHAGGNVNVTMVGGNLHGGGTVNVEEVTGNVASWGNVNADTVHGSVHARENTNVLFPMMPSQHL